MIFYKTLSITTIIILNYLAEINLFILNKNINYNYSKYIKQLIPEFKLYSNYINNYASIYDIDDKLVKSIIKVESSYNPYVVSKSHAIGLMQIKASTAGRDAYKLKGINREPSILELKDAATNIDIGTTYLFILHKQLSLILNTETRRYAIIVAYVNGAGALLRTFSTKSNSAIKKINKITAQEFYQYVQRNHPSPQQAQRYLWKVNITYLMMKNLLLKK